ncbi:sulfite exporter TauE/SafE family protein [Escherichia coli]|nr:sulfite exporter TauE/SafE family protein [Escherichia coli]
MLDALLPAGVDAGAALLLVIASFFTSALTASFGVGGGIAMLALLGVFTPVSVLIPVHGAVQLGSNTGRAWHQRAFVRWDVATPFIIGSVFGAIAGAFVVVQLPDALMKTVLGAFIILIVWTKIPGLERLNKAGLAIASSFLALISMMVGATGPLVSPVLAQFIPGDRKGLVATHAACMVFQHGLKILVFGLAGFAFGEWLPMVAAMIATGYLGTQYGSRLLDRMPEEAFRKWFRIGLTLLALDLMRRGLFSPTP